MGKAEGQVRAKEGLSASEESHRPKADEPCSAKEVVGTLKGSLGCSEKNWS